MPNCPYCQAVINQKAVRCRYCSSWLTTSPGTDEAVVYVVDRGLVYFTKFALFFLAVFIGGGAIFFGLDLKSARDEVEGAKQDVFQWRDDIRGLQLETSGQRESLDREVDAWRTEIKGYRDDILNQRNEARLLVATIEKPPLDTVQVEELVYAILQDVERARGSPDALLAALPARDGGLARMRQQASIRRIRADEALMEIRRPQQEVRVAIVGDNMSVDVPELRDRVIYSDEFISFYRQPRGDYALTTELVSLIATISRTARFMALSVMGDGMATHADILSAVAAAVDNGARIVVIPMGSRVPGGLQATIPHLDEVLFIAPAGNADSQDIVYPAGLPQVLAVGMTDVNDRRAGRSNYGRWIDLVAPGENIEVLTTGGGLRVASGAAYSAALVAGVAAQMLSIRPDLSSTEVVELLKASAADVGPSNPELAGLLGAGRIDAVEAIRAATAYTRQVGG